MSRIAIGSIAMVLLASLQCEPQETKVGRLTSLRQTQVLVEPLDADAKKAGLSRKSLESQMFVGLRRDIPGLAVRESARPFLYLQITMSSVRTAGGEGLRFNAFVNLRMLRPAMIQEDVGVGEVIFAFAEAWANGVLMSGSREHRIGHSLRVDFSQNRVEA